MGNEPFNNDNDSTNIESLLKQLNTRTSPDKTKAADTKARVKEQWQQMVKQQQKAKLQRRVWVLAASIMIATTLSLFIFDNLDTSEKVSFVATINDYSGSIRIKPENAPWINLKELSDLAKGVTIKTADASFLSLVLQDDSELRINENTELYFQADGVELIYGQIYHDTDFTQKAKPLKIKTTQGFIEHIGTRYLVSSLNNQVQIAVRSGEVKFSSNITHENDQLIKDNQMLNVAANKSAELSSIDSYDNLWDWTFQAQAGYELEGKSLFNFITWYAHQTGLSIDWNGLKFKSKNVKLHGNIKNISSEQAIRTVFLSTQFNYSINDGVLQINNK